MTIPLEDTFTDIIGKAQRGLKISTDDLAAKAGISTEAVEALSAGKFDEAAARKVAPVLNLNADALVAAGKASWSPQPVALDGLAQFNTPFEDMTVNNYLVWDPVSGEAVAFDSGADAGPLLDFVAFNKLTLKLILLTHTHGDHIIDLDRMKEKTGVPAFISSREPVEGAETFEVGREFTVGALRIGTRLTWGHSKGATTFVVNGLAKPVAIVGDAVFAGSMGGGGISYPDALRTNREEIMTLPDETILCPGHGPLTTVGEQRKHNPFLAE